MFFHVLLVLDSLGLVILVKNVEPRAEEHGSTASNRIPPLLSDGYATGHWNHLLLVPASGQDPRIRLYSNPGLILCRRLGFDDVIGVGGDPLYDVISAVMKLFQQGRSLVLHVEGPSQKTHWSRQMPVSPTEVDERLCREIPGLLASTNEAEELPFGDIVERYLQVTVQRVGSDSRNEIGEVLVVRQALSLGQDSTQGEAKGTTSIPVPSSCQPVFQQGKAL